MQRENIDVQRPSLGMRDVTAGRVVATQAHAQSIRLEMTVGTQTLADMEEEAILQEVLRMAGSDKSVAAKYFGITTVRFRFDAGSKCLGWAPGLVLASKAAGKCLRL
jgi:hypothetical protein